MKIMRKKIKTNKWNEIHLIYDLWRILNILIFLSFSLLVVFLLPTKCKFSSFCFFNVFNCVMQYCTRLCLIFFNVVTHTHNMANFFFLSIDAANYGWWWWSVSSVIDYDIFHSNQSMNDKYDMNVLIQTIFDISIHFL